LDAYQRRTGKLVGPLHGLPISVKDTFKITGCDTTIGLAALAYKPATENSTLVDLLLSLGAVIIAKTNIPQTLASLDSTNSIFGRTLNPINRRLTAGGSSGGEGVLVAMRGSAIGIGTDIGGSIRVPAMCNGIYGFKPSNGRVPFGGQENGNPEGKGRSGIQAVAGPIARSVADIDVLMREIVPRAELYDHECIPGCWPSQPPQNKPQKFTVGVLRSDGRITPLPPIARIIEEVAQTLGRTEGIEVVEIPAPKELGECQSIANALMAADGNDFMVDLIERTGEPLMPWLATRFKRGTPKTLAQLFKLQQRRSHIEKALMKLWTLGPGKGRRIDAIIHPVAPHPVPEMDRWNAVGYTSSFVLLDWPAGTIPVRNFTEADLELGKEMDSPVLTSWDERNRELCKLVLAQISFYEC
jgi:Asp-tRNA(Asn)/Glu-tRNA(Gln) amidotransferase A subunit family amidase